MSQQNDHKNSRRGFRQNHGKRGFVYVLQNEGLRPGLLKIGCSQRSGNDRANELNRDANTGTPGLYVCTFEWRTEDCGLAESVVHSILKSVRGGKRGQEFFQVSVEVARKIIIEECAAIDSTVRQTKQQKHRKNNAPPPVAPQYRRERIHRQASADRTGSEASNAESDATTAKRPEAPPAVPPEYRVERPWQR